MIFCIRTDKSEAEIALYEGSKCIEHYTWFAHRELSTTLHRKIEEMLSRYDKSWSDITGIVVFKGPGSFTGLRIGFTVANVMSLILAVPIVSCLGDNWIADGIARLGDGENEKISVPEYGGLPNITTPKK
ncbi:MAG: tRNA (adenosine(37)-N6)-threonylcarbamoyltransferase complex dimerization subunit type 1 TsaB [Candidatus Saccharibacteria bacterium]|nr:tRNA (adenosine(37)-N6)-threonylcarbamoyltransferase complex dimerization subunit type 1 TsaB [Candidatus Saccharibacteria bacterium]